MRATWSDNTEGTNRNVCAFCCFSPTRDLTSSLCHRYSELFLTYQVLVSLGQIDAGTRVIR
jgi:hypothetical protein